MNASEQDVAEMNGPDAVAGLLEADRVLLERVKRIVPALVTRLTGK